MPVNVQRKVHLSIRGPQGEIPFCVFDTKDGRSHAKNILEGRTYPLLSFLQNVRTVVDVGANVGAASLYFALRYPQTAVFAFEPFPEAYRLLAENLAPFPKVRTFGFGFLDRDVHMPMYLSGVDPVTNSVSVSGLNTSESQEISLRDAYSVLKELEITAIDILKIDTEGCEVPILRSLKGLLPYTRAIYLEYHDETDRCRIDAMLCDTHRLCAAHILHPHRGELCYGNSQDLQAEHLRIPDPTRDVAPTG